MVGSDTAIAGRVRAAQATLAAPRAGAPARELASLIAAWAAGPGPARLAAAAAPVFSAGDGGNLANYL